MLSRRISRIATRFFSYEKSFGLMNKEEKEAYLQKLEANSKVTYKKYPYLPHQDPKSPEYIHS